MTIVLYFDHFSLPNPPISPSAPSRRRTHGPCSRSAPFRPRFKRFPPSNHLGDLNDFSLPPSTCNNRNDQTPLITHFDFTVNPPRACYNRQHQPLPSIPTKPGFPSVPHLGFTNNDLNDLPTPWDHRESYVPTNLIPVDELNNSSTDSMPTPPSLPGTHNTPLSTIPDPAITHSTHDLG